MLKLWNVVLTIILLGVGYVITVALAYDGYCYGFSDGKTPCSFAQHFENNHDWFGVLLILCFPNILAVGACVYLVNDAIYRAFVARSIRQGRFPRF